MADEITFSNLNPFKKDAWKGNWDNAIQNMTDSFKSIPGIWKEGKEVRDKMYENSRKWRSAAAPKQNNGVVARASDSIGDAARTVNALIGGTIGTALQLILPQKLEEALSNLGQVVDIGKDINTVRSFLTPGEEILLPWDSKNKGLVDEHFAGDRRTRQNINDIANAVVAIMGTKGLKSGVSKVKSGIQKAKSEGVKATVKKDWKPIAEHIPVAANVVAASKALNSLKKTVAPKRLGGGHRVSNAGKTMFHTLSIFDPTMALNTYTLTGSLINK